MPTLTTAELQRRVLGFYRGPNMLALVGVGADRVVADITLMRQIADSWAFADAEGEQLDALGSVLQLRRTLGQTDDRYRVLLQMQAQILLSSVGSVAVIERVAEIWCGVPPTEYDEPVTGLGAEIVIGCTVDLTDYQPLLIYLRKAKIGGVRMNVHVGDADALINDYTPADPIDGATLIDYTPASPVTGAATLGYIHVL
jgi:hypothetical protein